MAVSIHLSIITLNENELNDSIRKYKVAEWIKNKTHLYTAYRRLQL